MINNSLYFDFGKQFNISGPRIILTSEKAGDIRDSEESRNRVLDQLGLSLDKFRLADQRHSQRVISADNPADSCAGGYDGLYTRSDYAVAVTVADCMPVYLFSRSRRICAVLHSGWKGTGILSKAVRIFNDIYGIKSNEMHTVFGPCIRSCCYKVDSDRAELFALKWGEDTVRRDKDCAFLDMAAANLKIAEQEGIGRIDDTGLCTCCDDRFGSYRRQGPSFIKMAAISGYF